MPPSRAVRALFPLALFLLACGSDAAPADTRPRVAVKVMTRNLYLGGAFEKILEAMSPAALPPLVGAFWTGVEASDIPGRARLLAAEIADQLPDLVGLQEVELFRTDAVSNFSFDAPVIDAATVRFDFLRLLLDELAARGVVYAVVSEQTRTDAELPGSVAGGALFDVRLTDRDVVLARDGVTATTVEARPFATYVAVNLGGKVPARLVRGFQLVEANVRGARLLFGHSHLEVGGLAVTFQERQADELATALANRAGPLVLVGDFNSPAAGGDGQTRSYATLMKTFRDVWSDLSPSDPGLTCCTDLASPTFAARTRIDLVLHRGGVRAQSAAVIGTDPARRTATGLWPSDHAGVVATVDVPM